MSINVISQSRYKIDRKRVVNTVSHILSKHKKIKDVSLNIVFVGKRKMKYLANTYKHEDVALPVLSFPYHTTETDQIATSEPVVTGEVIICFPQVVLLAAEKDKSLDNMLDELIVHGVENIVNS